MSIQQTSLEAYADHILSGAKTTLKNRVYSLLELCGSGGATRAQLTKALKLPAGNTISGAIQDLLMEGRAVIDLVDVCPVTGKNAQIVVFRSPAKKLG